MAVYSAPGVYVEVVKVAPPIQPAGTSTAGFVGKVNNDVDMPSRPVVAADGTIVITAYGLRAANAPLLITSFDQFVTNFGAPQQIAAVAAAAAVPAVAAVAAVPATAVTPAIPAVAAAPAIPAVAAVPARKDNLTLALAVFGFFQNGGSRCYVARTPADPTAADLTAILKKFEAIDEISLVAAPGVTERARADLLIQHCLKMKYRFAVIDGNNVEAIDRATITDVPLSSDNNFAALYYPWIKVTNQAARLATDPKTVEQPPSGHVCGIIARVDQATGTHYPPANEVVRGAQALKVDLTKEDQEGLNPAGVNLIRSFRGEIKVWGARTLAALGSDAGAFKYVNVQRTMSFIGKSIDDGTQFVVFKPNNPSLWAQVKRTATAFLTNMWRDGALFGVQPEDAFFVKVDAGNNPPELRELGILIIEIGVAIVQPAEFVVFRIQQFTQIPKP